LNSHRTVAAARPGYTHPLTRLPPHSSLAPNPHFVQFFAFILQHPHHPSKWLLLPGERARTPHVWHGQYADCIRSVPTAEVSCRSSIRRARRQVVGRRGLYRGVVGMSILHRGGEERTSARARARAQDTEKRRESLWTQLTAARSKSPSPRRCSRSAARPRPAVRPSSPPPPRPDR
jgi:hypothetical protein